MFAVLCEARVRPLPSFGSTAMFFCTKVDAAACLTDVDSLRFTLTVESVDAFAFAWGRLSFVAGAEDVLEGFATLVEKIAACLSEGALKLL